MSDTPRTDELSYISSACGGVRVVTAEHMAEIERELAAVTRERDDARLHADAEAVMCDLVAKERDEAAKERDALRAEVERLRKIAAYVPARVYIKAKEDAGSGSQIRIKEVAPSCHSCGRQEGDMAREDPSGRWVCGPCILGIAPIVKAALQEPTP